MKVELDIDITKIVEDISREVIKAMRPFVQQLVQLQDNDLFTVQSLSKYLEVSPQWVYERIQLKEIPYIKIGKFPRFRKSEIRTWLDSQKIPVVQSLSKRLKVVK